MHSTDDPDGAVSASAVMREQRNPPGGGLGDEISITERLGPFDCGCRRQIIPSTMGEPLLYKYFDEVFIEPLLAGEYGTGVFLNLTTNGAEQVTRRETWPETCRETSLQQRPVHHSW